MIAFVQHILEEIGYERLPITIFTDSSAALGTINREGAGRLKHIEVKCLWLQQALRRKLFDIQKVNTYDNPADLLTKHLPIKTMIEYSRRFGFLL